jgi:hypothetical protein
MICAEERGIPQMKVTNAINAIENFLDIYDDYSLTDFMLAGQEFKITRYQRLNTVAENGVSLGSLR